MIDMQSFVAEDNPILRLKADLVEFPLDDKLKELAFNMRQFLINSQNPKLAKKMGLRAGVGVAAPQVGVSKQVFAIYLVETNEDGEVKDVIIDQVFYNPKIIRHSLSKAYLHGGEGCLSVPRNVPGVVPRAERITIQFQDEDGQEHTLRFKDYEAIIIQHEIDHLNGILFYDHINKESPWSVDVNWKQI